MIIMHTGTTTSILYMYTSVMYIIIDSVRDRAPIFRMTTAQLKSQSKSESTLLVRNFLGGIFLILLQKWAAGATSCPTDF